MFQSEEWNLLSFRHVYDGLDPDGPELFVWWVGRSFYCIGGHAFSMRVSGQNICHDCGQNEAEWDPLTPLLSKWVRTPPDLL